MAITIKAARSNAGLTRSQAAQLLGVSDHTLQNWELGKTFPPIDKALMLAKLYGFSLSELDFLVD